jgi:hypothetical protein
MMGIAEYNKKYRLPCFFIGILAVLLRCTVIATGPKSWQYWTIIACIITSCSMGLGRVVFMITRKK